MADNVVELVRTDPDSPPVGVIDTSPMTPGKRVLFAVIAVVGAVSWAMIAFVRGESVTAVWFVLAAVATYVVAYRFYARLIEYTVVPAPHKELMSVRVPLL